MVDDEAAYLLSPYRYIRTVPGKQIRSRFALAFNLWLKVDAKTLDSIMAIIEILHNSSLMIDDIEDSSILRRGLPVTHNVYGIPRTINTANYMYFVALSKCMQLDHPEAVKIFTEQMLELHRGQGKELYWRDIVQCPTEQEYEQMVLQKTGGLITLTVHLMQLFGKPKCSYYSLIQNLALYLQIRDDYINLWSSTYADLKTFAEDLTEGKFSYPIIAAIGKRGQDDEVLNILRQRTKDVEVKKYCIRVMEQRGAFSYTLRRLQELHDGMISEIDTLGGNDELKSLIEMLYKDIQEIGYSAGSLVTNNGS